MIIGIDLGHTVNGPNYGAVGLLKESEQTRVLGNKVISYFKQLGHTVINCSVDNATSNADSLNKRVAKANAQKLDLFVSLHFNASNGQGHGTEIFTYGAKELVQARRMLNNLCAIGFSNRGIKNGSSLAVIKGAKWSAMLVETCFIDNKADIELYKTNIDKIAIAIVEGITGEKIAINEPLKANVNRPIAKLMIEEIKLLQGLFGLKQDGIVTEELLSKLPILVGVEKRGSVTIMQRILIYKGMLSSNSATGVIGPANVAALARFKSEVGIQNSNVLIDKNTWIKLLEY